MLLKDVNDMIDAAECNIYLRLDSVNGVEMDYGMVIQVSKREARYQVKNMYENGFEVRGQVVGAKVRDLYLYFRREPV